MPKKESVAIQQSSEEDYDSESDNGPKQPMREVNRANVLNYESDSSENVDQASSDE